MTIQMTVIDLLRVKTPLAPILVHVICTTLQMVLVPVLVEAMTDAVMLTNVSLIPFRVLASNV